MIKMEQSVKEYLGYELPEKYQKIANNVAKVLLGRKLEECELHQALMGELSCAEAIDPLVNISYYGGNAKAQFIHNRCKQVYRYWDLINRVAQAKEKIQAEVAGVPYETLRSFNTQEQHDMEQIAFLNHIGELEKIMASDEFNVDNHRQAWAKEKEKNPKLANYVERLGKMMQAEMKKAKFPLTDQMFMRTCTYQDAFQESGDHRQAFQMLVNYWHYGQDLCQQLAENLPPECLKNLKKEIPEDKPQLMVHHKGKVKRVNQKKRS